MPRTKQFDRDTVLAKAVELFWKKGYHATSIQDLVEHLGINRASMYDTFLGKEALFYESLRFYISSNKDKFKSIEEITASQTVRGFFTQFFFDDFQLMEEDRDGKGCFLVNATTELANSSDELCSIARSNHEMILGLFSELIQIGKDNGEILRQGNNHTMAMHLFTMFNGLKVLGKVHEDPEALKAVIDLELDYLFGSK